MQKNNIKVVLKFGGTSVGSVDRILATADIIRRFYKEETTQLAIVVSAMSGETNRLLGLVAQIDADASPRLSDVAVASGEQVSVALVSAAIEKIGLKAKPLLGHQLGIRTDSVYSSARVQAIDTKCIEAAWSRGEVVVVAGFQGVNSDGEITTLGRGGSDTSAVALAAALKADRCDIFTDVDGFFTADPRKIKDAKIITKMDYRVALEMAALGSKVLHSRCVEIGARYNIPITVRNSFDFKSITLEGTTLMHFDQQDAIESPVVSGVTVDNDVGRVGVYGKWDDSEAIALLFAALDEAKINVDVIVHSENQSEPALMQKISFTTVVRGVNSARDAIEVLRKQNPRCKDWIVETESDLAKVSIVGLGMQNSHGVARRAFSALLSNKVKIKMISTSEIKISCVVSRDQSENAAAILHREFIAL